MSSGLYPVHWVGLSGEMGTVQIETVHCIHHSHRNGTGPSGHNHQGRWTEEVSVVSERASGCAPELDSLCQGYLFCGGIRYHSAKPLGGSEDPLSL